MRVFAVFIASFSEEISELFVPATSNATPWSTEVLIIGMPSDILIELPKLKAFRTGRTWSWYMPRYASVSLSDFLEKAVSAEIG